MSLPTPVPQMHALAGDTESTGNLGWRTPVANSSAARSRRSWSRWRSWSAAGRRAMVGMRPILTGTARQHQLSPSDQHPELVRNFPSPHGTATVATGVATLQAFSRRRLKRPFAQQMRSKSALRTRTNHYRASLPRLVHWPATRGFVVGVLVGIPRWHARGQGFKSPQLHQAQRNDSTPNQGRLSANCLQITSREHESTLRADRFGWLQATLMRRDASEARTQASGCGRRPGLGACSTSDATSGIPGESTCVRPASSCRAGEEAGRRFSTPPSRPPSGSATTLMRPMASPW
jgi:hypothetical protein